LIRDYIAEHPDAGPTAVADAISLTGTSVTPAFVSTVKSTDKLKSKRRKGGGRRGGRAASGDSVSMDSLLKAKKLAEQMGGVEVAKAALDAYAKLVD
jgi:hypothetical protein